MDIGQRMAGMHAASDFVFPVNFCAAKFPLLLCACALGAIDGDLYTEGRRQPAFDTTPPTAETDRTQ